MKSRIRKHSVPEQRAQYMFKDINVTTNTYLFLLKKKKLTSDKHQQHSSKL